MRMQTPLLIVWAVFCTAANATQDYATDRHDLLDDSWEEDMGLVQAGDLELQEIPADDPRLSFTGRFSNPIKGVRWFSWSGSQILFRVKGNPNGMKVSLLPSKTFNAPMVVPGSVAGDRIGVIINGTMQHIIEAKKPGDFPLATSDMGSGTHEIVLWKLSEPGADTPPGSHNGDCGLRGLKIPAGAELIEKSENIPSRHLRFIGDSDTAAYCCDGKFDAPYGPAWSNVLTENNYMGWSAQLALLSHPKVLRTGSMPFAVLALLDAGVVG